MFSRIIFQYLFLSGTQLHTNLDLPHQAGILRQRKKNKNTPCFSSYRTLRKKRYALKAVNLVQLNSFYYNSRTQVICKENIQDCLKINFNFILFQQEIDKRGSRATAQQYGEEHAFP